MDKNGFKELKEINKKIMKFKNKEREQLVLFLFNESSKRIGEKIDKKKFKLILNLCQYLNEEKKEYLNYILELRIRNIREFILDSVKTDYSQYQNTIYKPEKWMNKLIEGINDTFLINENLKKSEYPVELSREVLNQKNMKEFIKRAIRKDEFIMDEIYKEDDLILAIEILNLKIIREFFKIFMGNNKFGKSGNQLILNFIRYSDNFKFLNYNFEPFIEEFHNNIKKEDKLALDELYLTYKEI